MYLSAGNIATVTAAKPAAIKASVPVNRVGCFLAVSVATWTCALAETAGIAAITRNRPDRSNERRCFVWFIGIMRRTGLGNWKLSQHGSFQRKSYDSPCRDRPHLLRYRRGSPTARF